MTEPATPTVTLHRHLLTWLPGLSADQLGLETLTSTYIVQPTSAVSFEDLCQRISHQTVMMVIQATSLSNEQQHELCETIIRHHPKGNLPVVVLEGSRAETQQPLDFLDNCAAVIPLPEAAASTAIHGLLEMIIRSADSAPLTTSPVAQAVAEPPTSKSWREGLNGIFHSVLQVIPLSVVIAHDRQCTRMTMNPAASQLLALPLEVNPSMTGPDREKLNMRIYRHGRLVPDRELPMQMTARTGIRNLGHEYLVVRSDGTKISIIIYTAPLFDQNDQPAGCVGIFVDVTDRKKMEQALSQSESRHKLALKCAKAGSWEWNIVTGEIIWSEEQCLLHGIENQRDITFEQWLDVIHEDEGEQVMHALKAQQEFQVEYRLRNPLGGVKWVLASGQVIGETKDKPQRMLGICMDITESKETEFALRENALRFRTMVDASPLGTFIIDAQGAYQYVNHQLEVITGMNQEELLAAGMLSIIHPDEKQEVQDDWHDSLGKHKRFDHICRLQLADGRTPWVHMRAAPVIDEDKLLGYIGKVEDITRQREAQVELRRSQDNLRLANATLAQRNEDMEELLSITAHDLKHPIVGIQGLLTLLKEDTYTKLDADSQMNLDLSLGECDRMKEMLTRLSELGRIEQTQPRLALVSIREVVDTCVKRYQVVSSKKGVTLTVDVQDKKLPMPRAIIEECLSNLLDNALKYGCKNSPCEVAISAWTHGQFCHFRVQDQGSGIDPKHHDRIFRPFRRLVSSNADAGSGLGLTAVKRLVQRIGGQVKVVSEVNQGACFEFWFPCASSGESS